MPLKSLFYPKSIAVIGASSDPAKIGHLVAKNIIQSDFQGKLFLVNRSGDEILGRKSYKNTLDIQTEIDTAIIVVPAKTVPNVISELGSKGVKNVIVISAGFKETSEEGAKLEKQIIDICQTYKIKLLGPNCLGLINLSQHKHSYNGSFAYQPTNRGGISLISQSGALISSFLDKADAEGFGFNKIVSLGNKAGLSEIEFVEYLEKDPETEVIAMYLEGFKDGKLLMKTLEKVKKPIILIKPGRSKETQEAISSHTGSIASDHKVGRMYLDKLGVIQVENLTEFFNTLSIFSRYKNFKNNNIVVVTNAGGAGVLTLDELAKTNLDLCNLSQERKDKLKTFLPPAASVNNPIDVLGDAKNERYFQTLEVCLRSEEVGGIIIILTPQANTAIDQTASSTVFFSNNYKDKPVIPVFIGGHLMDSARKIFSLGKVPYFDSPDSALEALNNLYHFNANKKRTDFLEKMKTDFDKKRLEKIEDEIKKAKNENKKSLPFRTLSLINETFDLNLADYKLLEPNSRLEEFEKSFEQIEKPVVLKVVSENILHRSDSGLVKVGVETLKGAKTFFEENKKEVILIQKMIEKGPEVFVGIQNDPSFGLSLVCGTGGIYAEIYEDFVLETIPTNPKFIEKALSKTKIFKVLDGARNQFYDKKQLIKNIYNLTKFACIFGEQITSIDVNPYICHKKGGAMVDFKVLI